MKEIVTTITINAPLANVWATLMDHERYPDWNPFITELKGDVSVGGQLDAHIQPPGQKGMRFQPIVKVLNPKKEFRWLGKLFVSGLFDGEHYFLLERIGPTTTQLIHGERFSGILASLLFRMVGKNTEAGFKVMNEAMKVRVEQMQGVISQKITIQNKKPTIQNITS